MDRLERHEHRLGRWSHPGWVSLGTVSYFDCLVASIYLHDAYAGVHRPSSRRALKLPGLSQRGCVASDL